MYTLYRNLPNSVYNDYNYCYIYDYFRIFFRVCANLNSLILICFHFLIKSLELEFYSIY